ncbi:MAG: hypothetical protein KQ78_00200 [Candidatus Izimaplasma bacterium HR2]|nr:MAG: hypothetical protein KQ78_00200 [Candidatus Izimaplasma bacterium HR2]
MYDYIKRNPIKIMIFVSAFAYFSRITDLVTAMLLYLFISTLEYGNSKKVLTKLSYSYIILVLIIGLYRMFMYLIRIKVITSELSTQDQYMVYSVGAFIVVLIRVIMFVVYLAMEYKNNIDKLFLVVLSIPFIAVIVTTIDMLIINKIYNFMLNWNLEDGFAAGAITLPTSSLFSMIQVILLVYLIMKPKDSVLIESYE